MDLAALINPVESLLALYVGPDQVMPVASILATIMGFLLIFWHKLLGILRKITRIFRGSSEQAAPPSPANPATKAPPGQS